MSELDLLRIICWGSIVIGVISMIVTIIPIASANGTRPLLIAFSSMAVTSFIGSLFLLVITYNIDQINSTGWAEVGVFYLRVKPGFIGLVLIWLGLRYWRMRHNH